MKIAIIFFIGVLFGWLLKIPFLWKWYKDLDEHRKLTKRVIEKLDLDVE